MLAPGIGAAAAEQQHLRDPGYSVRVARGPTEQRETTRPAGETLQELLSPEEVGLLEASMLYPEEPAVC